MKTYSFKDLCEALPRYSESGLRKRLMKDGIRRAKGTKYLVFSELMFEKIKRRPSKRSSVVECSPMRLRSMVRTHPLVVFNVTTPWHPTRK